MKLEIYDLDKKLIYKTEEKELVLNKLLEILYIRDIINYKTKYVKHYKYNYTDKQKLVFINYQDKLKYVFINIPTVWGYLDI